MSIDGDIKLTKFKSAATVVTADFANSIFGGLYGSADSVGLDEDDPRVRGHVHDGQRGDGHSSRVHLVDHVESQLTNPNLGDDAVTKRNVFDTSEQADAIPEYRVDSDSGKTYYYLDLRAIRADLPFVEDNDPAGDGSQHKTVRQRGQFFDGDVYVDIPDVWSTSDGRDFVFGSYSLEDLNFPSEDGDSRFFFDKSLACFRAGAVQGSQWDETNRGVVSFAVGLNNTASGDFSSVTGGAESFSKGHYSSVLSGFSNESGGNYSSVVSGMDNRSFGHYSLVGAGGQNIVNGDVSAVLIGQENVVEQSNSLILSGFKNTVVGHYSAVLSGANNNNAGSYSVILGGTLNKQHSDNALIFGTENEIKNDSIGAIVFGHDSVLGKSSHYSVMLNSLASSIGDGSGFSAVIASESSSIGNNSNYSGLLFGANSRVFDNSDSSIILGANNQVSGINSSVLGGVHNLVYGEGSSSLGSNGAKITGSMGSFVAGSIGGCFIGEEYTSINGYVVPKSPSDLSGIVGGVDNKIVGGPFSGPRPSVSNFIVASESSSIGGIEMSVNNNQIIGGSRNEITGAGSSRPAPHLDHSIIVGGRLNSILAAQSSSEILYGGIIGGYLNGINTVHPTLPMTPWYGNQAPQTHARAPASEFGVQTSYIFGGQYNSITNNATPAFDKNSVNSVILGGDANILTSSFGSAILGGGRVIDETGNDKPNYDYKSGFYSNVISSSKNSTIIGGSSNLIAPQAFPFNNLGPFSSKLDYMVLADPHFATAKGLESYSYSYGQNSKASGGHNKGKFEKLGFQSVGLPLAPGPEMATIWGSGLNGNEVTNQPGSAQTFSLNYFGSWDYGKANITPTPWTGMFFDTVSKDSYFPFYATLDGSDNLPSELKGFTPRWPGSYKVTVDGSISYSEQQNSFKHGVVNFRYNAYIVMQPDGSCTYGGVLEPSYGSNPNVSVGLSRPSATGLGTTHDFLISFAPFFDVAESIAATAEVVTTPHLAHDTVTVSAIGTEEAKKEVDPGWPGPVAVPGAAWPYSFVILVANNSTTIVSGSTNGTSNLLVGESLVANVEVVENLLHLTGFDPSA